MKKIIFASLFILLPQLVFAGSQTSAPPLPAAATQPAPSAQFIAQIEKQLSSDPKSAKLSPYQLETIARQIATQIVRSGKAPTGSIATSTPQTPTQDTQNGLANCFAYYKFGSVQAHLDAGVTKTVSGSPVTFSGTLQNTNPYPIVDGTLYVKIFRYPAAFDAQNGPDVVDQFVALDNITIPADGSVPASFSWTVPEYAQSGDYAAAMFFTTEHKFNLLGLSFTDDVTGNTAPFKVAGEQQSLVAFVKDAVTVGGAAYHFAEPPPHAGQAGDIAVEAEIANTSGAAQTPPVHWQLYSWDAQQPSNLIAESTTTVSVPAGGTASVSYTIHDTSVPVYLLVGTVTWHDTKSIIGVRVIRDGIDKLRINFPSITAFPLQAGKENTIFSCFSNSSDGTVQNGRLDLRLLDPQGNVIASSSYAGPVGGNMMAIAKTFMPTKSYDAFSIEAKLYQDGHLVDETTVRYDCKAIDPASCSHTTSYPEIIPITAAILVLLGGYVLWRRRPQSTKPV
jgi:hypothetical protein